MDTFIVLMVVTTFLTFGVGIVMIGIGVLRGTHLIRQLLALGLEARAERRRHGG